VIKRDEDFTEGMSMRERMHFAGEELKRAEHLLYVSLKYTRTVDVIKSLIDRLITCFDILIDGILEHKEEEGAISEAPKSHFNKIESMKTLYVNDREMLEYVDFYTLLRKIARAQFSGASEFRRNVTMTSNVDGQSIEINIDISGDYFHKTVDFLRFIKEYHLTKGK
jgi:hypothetical protein